MINPVSRVAAGPRFTRITMIKTLMKYVLKNFHDLKINVIFRLNIYLNLTVRVSWLVKSIFDCVLKPKFLLNVGAVLDSLQF